MSEVVPVAHTPAGDEPHEEEARMSAKMTVVPFTEVRLPIEKSVLTCCSKSTIMQPQFVLFKHIHKFDKHFCILFQ